MPISEVGHARNISAFEQMISYVTAYGGDYNPSNANISLAKLTNKLNASNTAMDDVMTKVAAYTTAVNVRENAFKPLGPTVTRAVNYYASTGTEDNKVADAKSLNRKVQGKRATPAKKDDPSTPEDESKGSHSASQQSYTQKVEHLDGIIELFKSDGLYNPNENDIKTAQLDALSVTLKSANTGVINAITDRSNSRIDRNEVLYKDGTGLYALAMLVKKYVKALFGASSPEYKQVSKLRFRNEEL
ncbi:MAG: hypothetical protein IPI64_06925 [Chloracidobacterium sp.]|nr:hypothetical protein [Chloracidobacterium sp.]